MRSIHFKLFLLVAPLSILINASLCLATDTDGIAALNSKSEDVKPADPLDGILSELNPAFEFSSQGSTRPKSTFEVAQRILKNQIDKGTRQVDLLNQQVRKYALARQVAPSADQQEVEALQKKAIKSFERKLNENLSLYDQGMYSREACVAKRAETMQDHYQERNCVDLERQMRSAAANIQEASHNLNLEIVSIKPQRQRVAPSPTSASQIQNPWEVDMTGY